MLRAFQILLLACFATAVQAQSPPSTPFKQCPPIGASASCAILIVINANGTANVYADSKVGAYEGQDDTLIGVQNNSGHTITSLPLNGGQVPIFAFEADGICDPLTATFGASLPSGCPFGPTGYEGPGVSFTNINGSFASCNVQEPNGTVTWSCANDSSASYTTGTVNFSPGIPNGGSAYFALEEALTAAQVTVPLSTTCPTATAAVNTVYSSTLVGTGGNGIYHWSLQSGSLGSLSLSQGGVVSGTPNAAGTLSFSLLIGDSVNDPAQPQACTIKVAAAPLSLSCNAPTSALAAGAPYSATCTATGGTTTYAWTNSNLPAWLTATPNGATLTLTGTVPSPPPSSYSPTITVTDSTTPTKQTQSQTITINVSTPALTISCSAPATATAGVAYSGSCTAGGGTPSYNWTYSNLPAWLVAGKLGATVTLSGTPPSPPPSSYTFTATVTDSTAAAPQSRSQSITITVAAPALTVSCAAPLTANAGVAYAGNCTAAGGTSPYTWTYSGLPAWLTGGASGSTVALTGTPPAPPPATYTFTATVTDGGSPTPQSKSQSLTINVAFQPVQGVTVTQNSGSSTPNQTTLTVQFGQAANATYTGTLTLTFKPDTSVTNVPAGYVDPAAGFPISGQTTTSLTQTFTINQGQTQATAAFALGTVAGTWTATVTALSGGVPSPAPSFSTSVAAAAPSITAGSVKIVNATSSSFTVQLSGVASTRDVASATFSFTAASGAQLNGGTVTVPFNGQDQSQWFTTSPGLAAGGTFSLSLPFGYTGDPNALGSVSVTLTNSKGQTSTAVSGTK